MIKTKNKLIRFDNLLIKDFTDYFFIGIDEVGRGALAGPVIACAFSWKESFLEKKPKHFNVSMSKLNDSKQLTKKEREELYVSLLKFGSFALGYSSVSEIEKLNILNATFLAMKRAFDNLVLSLSDTQALNPYVLIDGDKFNPFINCLQIPIVGGDAKSSVIAAASIIAKVYRDELMYRISKSKKYNKFSWQTNVGYGTKFHCRAIKKHGLTPLHRKLFVRKVLGNKANCF